MTSPLMTPDEVAERLRCSRKTLSAHVRNGDLKYIIIGHGKKRPRKMFAEADVGEFLKRRTRRETTDSIPHRSESDLDKEMFGSLERHDQRHDVRRGKSMVLLAAAAERLAISMKELLQRLEAAQIAVVGKGKRARITESDIERIARPSTRVVERSADNHERFRQFMFQRSARMLSQSTDAAGTVVPFRPRPKK